jgi:dihydrofolate synthase/folylpolyglutamate synthase
VATGLAHPGWPGRLELRHLPDGRDILLDAAHNPAGAAALATALDDLRPFLAEGRVAVVTASMADKDVDGVVAALSRSAALRGARVIATQLDVPRALPAQELAARWSRVTEPGWQVKAEPDPAAALDRAIAAADGPVVVAGSLYLVGFARGRLVDDPRLRDPVPVGR